MLHRTSTLRKRQQKKQEEKRERKETDPVVQRASELIERYNLRMPRSGHDPKKRPYHYFCQERKRLDPDMYSDKSQSEMLELCTSAWESMTLWERQPYVRMAQDEENHFANSNLKREPFVFYCMERKRLDPDRYSGKSLPEMLDLCSTAWEAMTPADRQPYVRMAQQVNQNHGSSLLALEKVRISEEDEHEAMLRDIDHRVADATGKDMRFHILYCNVWIRTDHQVYPAEIGLVEVSLKKGIVSVYNQIIDPGDPPRGCRGKMKAISNENHGIWLDNKHLNSDYAGILEKIRSVLKPKEGEVVAGKYVSHAPPFDYLPLYVMPENREDCQGAIKWLCHRVGVIDDFPLYDLHHLFCVLTSTAHDERPIQSLNLVDSYLNRDVNCVACEFHEGTDNHNCAGAEASRQAQIICDLCNQLNGTDPSEETTPDEDFISEDISSAASSGTEIAFQQQNHTSVIQDYHPVREIFDDEGNILSKEELLLRRGDKKPDKNPVPS